MSWTVASVPVIVSMTVGVSLRMALWWSVPAVRSVLMLLHIIIRRE